MGENSGTNMLNVLVLCRVLKTYSRKTWERAAVSCVFCRHWIKDRRKRERPKQTRKNERYICVVNWCLIGSCE